MSQSIASTLPAAPTTLDVAQRILATMQAMSGVATDYNIGSQIRTFSEAAGSVIEMQSIAAQQQAYLSLTYGSISAVGITPLGATLANGFVTFATGNILPYPPATQTVLIPAGTIVQSTGGVQFQTVTAATLATGATSITVPVSAIVAGTSGNVSAGTITQILTGVGYSLYLSNAAATTGGAAAETPSATLARFAAQEATYGLCSPFAVANAAIGVINGSEVVQYAACYEPWINNPIASGQAGFTLYIDNGLGTASSGLIANVITKITGNQVTGVSGYRPVGVPFPCRQ